MKGNHKILPSISPKKSWEGTIAGLVGSVLMSVVLWKYLQISGANAIVPIVFGVFLFIGGFAGDLAESSLKRICNVKDSGTLVPGMGGVLDVLDSLLLNAPVFTLLCIYTF
jgi:phosphatidate cytidylyltransferase